jgi:NDP-sugar pyrophosphorylase family protein
METLKKDYKGVILAAGFGSRMKPLTNALPKPMIEFCGVPLIFLSLFKMKMAGIQDVAVNTYYHADKLESLLLKSTDFGLSLPYLIREKELMGTAGVYSNLLDWIDSSSVLSINSDIVSDFDLNILMQNFSEELLALLSVKSSAHSSGNQVWVLENKKKVKKIIDISNFCRENPEAKPFGFQGFQIISSYLIKSLPQEIPSEIIPFYQNLLLKKRELYAIVNDSFWFDVGTFVSFWYAHMAVLSYGAVLIEKIGLSYFWNFNKRFNFVSDSKNRIDGINLKSPLIINDGLKYKKNLTIGPYVVCNENVCIGKNVDISYSVILDGAIVSDNSKIKNCIIGKDLFVQIPDPDVSRLLERL